MTITEACERAATIWCGPMSVQLRGDGSVDITLASIPAKFVGTDNQYTLFTYHALDKHGYAICHSACREVAGRKS